jgi:hypothetical protein
MTTTQKITFTPAAPQETTASASHDREQREDMILYSTTRPSERKAKPAYAHAASAHTPLPWKLRDSKYLNEQGHYPIVGADGNLICETHVLYDGSGRREQYPDGIVVSKETAEANARLIIATSETAAERDRLKLDLEYWKPASLRNVERIKALRKQRDQAREQVKTLMAVCKSFSGFSFTDYEARFNTTAALGRLVILKRSARAAIKAVESEDQ